MTETTLEVRIPTPLLQFGLDQTEIQQRMREWLVFSLFTEEHISSGKAARLLRLAASNFWRYYERTKLPISTIQVMNLLKNSLPLTR